ncbi:MAG: SpoIIE family protein phosphatase [Planctomycetes bacterium]|nr:SpoIIE family protein phosphatase [Planctomycetota bacterium]
MQSTQTKVLFVEDNPVDARMIERSLARSVHTTFALHHVSDLASALADLRNVGDFDAVLLDLMLPDSLGGVDTIRAIHEIHREIPIVVFTGMEDTELALAAVREGAQDYLVKEKCDAENVVRAIRYSIERVRHTIDERALGEARHQLGMGGRVQQAKFPRAAPDLPGYDIAGVCVPAEATGGDYFDYFPIADRYLGLAIGDASGHGLGPAMVMSDVRAILRTLTTVYSDIGDIMHLLNQIAVRDLNVNMFMTLFLVRLEPETGGFHYAGAGHNAIVLNKHGERRDELPPAFPPLNVVADFEFTAATTDRLAPGETLLLYTDGITESHAQGSHTNLFGEDRMLELVRGQYLAPSNVLARQIVEAAREFASPDDPEDDMTVVVAKRLSEEA